MADDTGNENTPPDEAALALERAHLELERAQSRFEREREAFRDMIENLGASVGGMSVELSRLQRLPDTLLEESGGVSEEYADALANYRAAELVQVCARAVLRTLPEQSANEAAVTSVTERVEGILEPFAVPPPDVWHIRNETRRHRLAALRLHTLRVMFQGFWAGAMEGLRNIFDHGESVVEILATFEVAADIPPSAEEH